MANCDDSPAIKQRLRSLHADPAARERWMTYHLIGDVLRSSDLAHAPGDALALRVHQALLQEPVLLSPRSAPDAAASLRTSRWRGPVAAVAGVALVAGAWVLVRPQAPQSDSGPLAAVSPVDRVVALPAPQPAASGLVRDAQLDRYLAAHQEYAGATAIGGSAGLLRASSLAPGSR